MASISDYYELRLLDSLRNVSAAIASVYCKLHVGDSGEAGTANAAVETSRKIVTFAAAAAGAMASNSVMTWASVAGTETISHFSLWDTVGPAGGNNLWNGILVVPRAVIIGDTFEVISGGLVLSLD